MKAYSLITDSYIQLLIYEKIVMPLNCRLSVAFKVIPTSNHFTTQILERTYLIPASYREKYFYCPFYSPPPRTYCYR